MTKSSCISLFYLLDLITFSYISILVKSVVTPSLVFYVTEVGGTVKQYGLISSVPFFSMMLMMSFYGVWVDSNGNKYKKPYAASFAFGGLGSLLYFLAELLPSGAWAVYTILLGRFITGLGAAGRTLAYSYVATAIPRDQQRTTMTILSMTKSFGMLLGPLLNLLVVNIESSISIFNYTVPLNPRNSVGLVLAAGELFLFILTSLFLQEPPPKKEKPLTEDTNPTKVGGKELWAAVTHFDLLFPAFIMFVLVSNFTL
jgi:MFS family permease